jgi:GT2 family glycosyltransferase/glycosyltransferase involved in cell wall biosynthesis/ubiquinone/menaquinone biosynthesis C-methylase UbiE
MPSSVKWKALWRHPMDSRKRKEFCTGRQPLLQKKVVGKTRMWVNLAAILRHPLSRNQRRIWRNVALDGSANTGAVKAVFQSTSEALHSRLFDCYVQNSLGQFDPSEYVEIATEAAPADASDVKLIAYYLPQFHPIPENDKWWGKGFTEWRNVTRAYPQFDGHYQPRVPGELGYYDLRVVDVMRRQVELAKLYGIHAFCFHFYWFGGTRLLETPILNYLENQDLDLPFCLCWANENWSRRWDGSEHEVLISQSHSSEDDADLLRYLDKYFRDERYLKIDGKPVLTVYRPSILPDAAKTVDRWREIAKELGYPGIYLIATNSFAFTDYKKFGFDALSEFPPHHVAASNIQNEFQMSHYRNGWRVRSYAEIVTSEETRNPVAGTVFPGVMPGWDNSARRPTNGEIIHGATPAFFEQWLRQAFARAQSNSPAERFVVINAWNEWAEGAYLEPDKRFGYANLAACASAIRNHVDTAEMRFIAGKRVRQDSSKTILLCSHHAGKQVFGGERSFLDVARALAEGGFNVAVTVQEGVNAEYIKELRKYAQEVHIFKYNQWTSSSTDTYESTSRFLRVIDSVKPDLVYVNTIVVASPLVAARLRGIPSVVHAREIIVHDEDLQKQIGLIGPEVVKKVLESSDFIVANSHATAQCFSGGNVTTIPNTIDVDSFAVPRAEPKDTVTFGLISSNLPKKGIQDFVALAQTCVKLAPNARFLIIGPLSRPLIKEYLSSKRRSPKNLNFIDYQPTSREAIGMVDVVVNFSHFQESFGRTVLEGMAAGCPSLVYDWGALSELVEHGVTGFLVPFGEPSEAAKHVQLMCTDRELLRRMGSAARQRSEVYSFPHFKQKVVTFCRDAIATGPVQNVYSAVRENRLRSVANKSVDIVVCVHNALRDVKACLASVRTNLGVGHRIILVDDGSNEETREYLEKFAGDNRVVLRRNDVAQGYTRSANLGLALTSADLVVLLNSDTIVTKNWAEKLADAAFSTPGVGAVGPLSNAASYQSIPSIVGTDKQTPVNNLPRNMSPDEMNAWCENHSTSVVPLVPLVHGFCLGITRQALESVGNFDEAAFPDGYGEENDYCFRLSAAGFRMVIATHTYVYHVKSSSYTEERRHQLSERAQGVLYSRYGRGHFDAAVQSLEQNASLSIVRALAKSMYDEVQPHAPGGSTARQPHPYILSELDDGQWLKTLQASVESRVVDGIEYPGFPDPVLQVGTVGSSGQGTIAEGFRFYSFIRDVAASNGMKLGPDSRVLDFGVSWGRIIRCLLRDVSPSGLYGVDTSDRFLSAARQTGVPGDLRLIQPDGNLPFKDSTFDVVYAYSVFTHLPEHIQNIWLAEIARTLKPGGIFVATVQPPRFLEFIQNADKQKVAKSAWLQQLQAAVSKIGDAPARLMESDFIFLPTNNGKTYGDTIMTRDYVNKVWGKHFIIDEYLDDVTRFQQAVVTARLRR